MKVFVDTETSGLDPRHHSILSICLGSKEIGYSTFHFQPDPDMIIDPVALGINNIDLDGIWSDHTDQFKEHLEYLLERFGQLEPIGHNYMFDIGFIQQITGVKGYSKYFSRRYLDTMIIAKFLSEVGMVMSESYSLAHLCESFNIENKGAHTAEGDVKATEKLYEALIGLF